MSSSGSYRPDPFSQPFVATAVEVHPAPQPPRSQLWRSALLFAAVFGFVIGCALFFFTPAMVSAWHVADADESAANKDEKQAVAHLDSALAWQPSDLELRARRCRMLARLGELEKAKADLARIEAALGDDSKLTNDKIALRATLRQECGQFRLAMADQKRLVDWSKAESAPPYIQAMMLNNHAYIVGLAVEFEPKDPVQDNELLASALEDCDKALQMAPGEGFILDTRGYIHTLLGNNSLAIADIDQALRLAVKTLKERQALAVKGSRESIANSLEIRELERSVAINHLHRMKAHQQAGNTEEAEKDRQAIIAAGFDPKLPLN